MPNLIKNPSFEKGLEDWTTNNVVTTNQNPYEGTSVARMGSGTAILSQDVNLKFKEEEDDDDDYDEDKDFLFSFAVQSLFFDPGDLTVRIEWLNKKGGKIGTGLSLSISSATLGNQLFWMTYSDLTECVPANTRKARIVFTKESGTGTNTIDIDKVLLTPKKEDD